jgi:hypothetical protein
MIDIITAEMLEAKVREIATANPDYIYDTIIDCKYTTPNNGCLIGQALVSLEPELLPVLQEIDAHRMVGIDVLPEKLPMKLTISKWLCRVQSAQDTGLCWSKCVKRADSWVLNPEWEYND